MSTKKSLRPQTLGEEISNSVSHGIGALLAVAGTVILIIKAALTSNALGVTSACLYGASLIILYTFSTLYHSLTNETAKYVFRIFDHCSIFLLIFGSYVPISLVLIGGAVGWILFSVNLFCTVIGITFNSINISKWHKASLVLYIIMGWSIVFSIESLVSAIHFNGLVLLVLGGLAYTLGITFYRMKKFKYMHFIWHIFVLAGSILQYFSILLYCY